MCKIKLFSFHFINNVTSNDKQLKQRTIKRCEFRYHDSIILT